MRIIGINGFKTSGKDTAYTFIQRQVDDAKRAAFADNLKVMAALALGLEGDRQSLIALMNICKERWEIEIYDKDRFPMQHGLSGREYLQHFGNHAREMFGKTFWIDQVVPPTYVEAVALHDAPLLVVTDVRYPNEAERIHDVGGEVWEVVRPGLESDGHASEIPLSRDLVDITIINDGSLEDFENKVKEALGC